MSDPVVIVIPHTLGKAEALRRLQPGLTALAGNAPMFTVEQETWNGEELTFRVSTLGQSASGSLLVGENDVRIALVLPWLLRQIAGGLETAIHERGRALLEDKTRQA